MNRNDLAIFMACGTTSVIKKQLMRSTKIRAVGAMSGSLQWVTVINISAVDFTNFPGYIKNFLR